MTIDEAIKEMLRSAEMNRHMAERCRYANSMQPSLYDVEAGVQYSNAAEKYHQIAKWLEELKELRATSCGYSKEDIELNRTAMYNKAIDDFAKDAKKMADRWWGNCCINVPDINEIAEKLKKV